MIAFTRDPITLNDVVNLADAPFVVEGQGAGRVKIYFESEANRREYMETATHGGVQSTGLRKIFDDMADNPNTGSIH
jgi:hypothetical protein